MSCAASRRPVTSVPASHRRQARHPALPAHDALVSPTRRRGCAGTPYDHIIVESSGVAEPRLLRAMFQQASAMDWPLMRCLRLENMVTVVDASAFLSEYQSADKIAERPDLLGPDEAAVAADDSILAGGMGEAGGAVAQMGVVQLLVEQVETADVIVLNKADVASEAELIQCVASLRRPRGWRTGGGQRARCWGKGGIGGWVCCVGGWVLYISGRVCVCVCASVARLYLRRAEGAATDHSASPLPNHAPVPDASSCRPCLPKCRAGVADLPSFPQLGRIRLRLPPPHTTRRRLEQILTPFIPNPGIGWSRSLPHSTALPRCTGLSSE